MTNQEVIFIAVLIINTIVAAVYVLCMHLRNTMKRSSWIKGFAMVLCPVVGPLVVFLSFLCYKFLFRNQVDLEGVIFSKDRVRANVMADEESESNVIPLEEALLISDEDDLRNLMLKVVREKSGQSLATISLALGSEDTETSHYAASLLQEKLNGYRMTVQKAVHLLDKLKKEENELREAGRDQQADQKVREQIACAKSLLGYMNPVMEEHVFNEIEQRSYAYMMEQAGTILYEKDIQHMDAKYYEYICVQMTDVKEYALAEVWADRLAENFPDLLSAYTCRLRLYFENGNKESFFRIMEELKKSDIVLDEATLVLVRTFS